MTDEDKNLLELAARTAGFEAGWVLQGWNPITDDGDALRLAVQLGFSVEPGRCWRSHHSQVFVEDVLCGVMIATRRAIVSAAAEIGRSM